MGETLAAVCCMAAALLATTYAQLYIIHIHMYYCQTAGYWRFLTFDGSDDDCHIVEPGGHCFLEANFEVFARLAACE